MDEIREELAQIKARNQRVEAEKAWETSWTRAALVTATTYVIATVVMYAIGVEKYLQNALIPAIGYFLSTQSLPFVKKHWMQNYRK